MLIMQLTHVKCGMHTWVSHGKAVEHECGVGKVQAGKVTKQSVVDTVGSLWRTGGHPEKQQLLSFSWQFSSPKVGSLLHIFTEKSSV